MFHFESLMTEFVSRLAVLQRGGKSIETWTVLYSHNKPGFTLAAPPNREFEIIFSAFMI
jgi:hypothetical protein